MGISYFEFEFDPDRPIESSTGDMIDTVYVGCRLIDLARYAMVVEQLWNEGSIDKRCVQPYEPPRPRSHPGLLSPD